MIRYKDIGIINHIGGSRDRLLLDSPDVVKIRPALGSGSRSLGIFSISNDKMS